MPSITLSGFIRIDNPLIFSMENLSDTYKASTIKSKIAQVYTFTNDDYHIRVWASANFIDLGNKAIGVFVTSSAYSRKGFYAVAEEMLRTSGYNVIELMEHTSLKDVTDDINLFKESMGLKKTTRFSKALLKDWTARANHAKSALNQDYNEYFFEMPQRRSEFNAFLNAVMKYNTLSVNKLAPIVKSANDKYNHHIISQFKMG